MSRTKLAEKILKALEDDDVLPHPDDPDDGQSWLCQAADELDCGRDCRHGYYEPDTNHSGCHRPDRDGQFCFADMANALRQISKVAREPHE